jgi:hypothetical protein
MGAHSTINVTRKTALELYLKRFPQITDKELEDFLGYHLDKYLYNVNIVPDDYEFREDVLQGDRIARSHLE